MSWKDKLDLLLLKLKVSIEPCFIGDKGTQDIKDFIEALLKETEKRISQEIVSSLDDLIRIDSDKVFNNIQTELIQTKNYFREKYIKGVE